MVINGDLPSGKHTKNYGTSQFSMGKSTMEITIFNSLVNVYRRVFRGYGVFQKWEYPNSWMVYTGKLY